MGHLQDMSPQRKREFQAHQYKRMLEERRGNSFEYYNEEKHEKLILDKGWNWYTFRGNEDYTSSQLEAQEIVTKLRSENNHARIVCGLHKDVQRTKYFSVIYKAKKNEPTSKTKS